MILLDSEIRQKEQFLERYFTRIKEMLILNIHKSQLTQ